MARNYPECQWIFNSEFLTQEADRLNVSESEVEGVYHEKYGPCEYIPFSYKTDAYIYSIIACYCIIIPIGILGNLTVIYTVLTVDELKNVVNLLLVALACSDLLMTIAMPFTFLFNISYSYLASEAACKAVPVIQGTAVMSGIYALVLISVERFYAIVHPFHDAIIKTSCRVALSVALIWTLSACFQIPLPIVSEVDELSYMIGWNSTQEVDNCTAEEMICFSIKQRMCYETWDISQALVFSYSVLVVMYIIPLALLTFFYSRIGYAMWKRKPVGAEVRSYKQRRRLVVFLVVLVVVFAVTWGPYFILQCFIGQQINPILAGYLQVMGHSNVALDPILYALFHQNIRKHVILKFKKLKTCCKSRKNTVSGAELTRTNFPPRTVCNVSSHKSVEPPSAISGDEVGVVGDKHSSLGRDRSSSSFSYDDLILRISDIRRRSEPLTEKSGPSEFINNAFALPTVDPDDEIKSLRSESSTNSLPDASNASLPNSTADT
ncbi:QRFP-like peptide receptor [Styela clava]